MGYLPVVHRSLIQDQFIFYTASGQNGAFKLVDPNRPDRLYLKLRVWLLSFATDFTAP